MLIPREDEGEGKVVDGAVERFAEREGDFNGAVRVVALAAVQNAREAVDLTEVEVVDAVLAAGER